MTLPQFVALATAWGKHASPAMRMRAARVLGAMATEPEASECAKEDREQAELARAFEESQLAGPELERRRREPA